jgi:acetate kinase
MGMTPLEGLVMGSRCGDVDPGIFTYLKHTLNLTVEQIESALYHDSGLAGLSGFGNDVRDIEKQVTAGNKKALFALEIYAYRVKKYIGSYAAAMGGVDAVAFTAGVGEHSADMRSRICSGLEFLGLDFDEALNEQVKLSAFEAPALHKPSSKVAVFVTKAREQWMIAGDTQRVLSAASAQRHEPSLHKKTATH